METKLIPLSDIDTSGFNSRVTAENQEEYKGEIVALAKNIGDVGLLSPVLVSLNESGKGYNLIAGFRRYAATTYLAVEGRCPPAIQARVYPFVTEAQRIFLNLTENLARKDISTYETARGCAALEDSGFKGEEIAEKLAFASRSHVNNLIRAFRGLIEPIKKAWSRAVGFCTTTWLFSVSALKPDNQQLEYDKQIGAQQGEGGAKEEPSSGEKEAKPEKVKPPKVRSSADIDRAFTEALKVLTSLKANPVIFKTVASLHAFVKGEAESFAGIDLNKERADVVTEKEKEKAAKAQLVAQEKLKLAKERIAALEAAAIGKPLPKTEKPTTDKPKAKGK